MLLVKIYLLHVHLRGISDPFYLRPTSHIQIRGDATDLEGSAISEAINAL